ncbi:MAG: tetratricopeptide repeat protein [Oscillatoriales cyanobacterium]|uniref:Tetratricopeptide repeat protein n=1 Tax=Microcoleus anatoxicus PTRS2 TaxID=2705321 RepID=A0ABU8YWZ2_9CYAN|nr:MAG: tetratricopeptide repeat protein [Oscillatoriales cyanobacterium]TAD94913.1 MAG: tetratricopeptide repeat protein [Oscillatoriales cyanobacterium]TAD99746.1 MAG: tetratricopeptide repeat protein [Oscillatoriales cyanobacterium]TAF28872.1 MAG: tetratricopeptide repeat protein [Oscillatoriales cyanobacterium]TAF57696.1 MAG: tetratricopeptide repeat protein [Oscillatoriales cyanobacterium]
MNEKRRETYLTLIQSLLNSPEDEQIALLQQHLELLDDGFAQYLREWATQTLAEMESEEASKFASNIYSFNIVIGDFPLGSRANNLEIAIACDEIALTVWNRDDYAQKWAMIQNSMAIDYRNRIRGDRGENIEKAIECYEAALEVYTRLALPQNWAMTQNNLAIDYRNRIWGDRGENIEKAIRLFKAALEVRTPTTLPLSCLNTARNLGDLAFAESLWETAIFGYEKAIEAVEQSREWIASENRKREIIGENLNVYEKMIQSCINHQQYHKAIQTIERSKSRYLVELFTNVQMYPLNK